MKPTSILINTSRGGVIDEIALSRCLADCCIAGAALDVFEDEPHITERLYTLEQVVLTPHIGTATIDARITMSREAVENIRNFFAGTPTNVVN